jgi:hypothetical protein
MGYILYHYGRVKMTKFKVYVTVYHMIDDIEASNEDEAKELAASDYNWNDHIKDCIVDVEEIDND